MRKKTEMQDADKLEENEDGNGQLRGRPSRNLFLKKSAPKANESIFRKHFVWQEKPQLHLVTHFEERHLLSNAQ